MIGHGFRGMLSGFGSIVAPTVTTTGAVVAGTTVTAGTGITATTGNIQATTGVFRGADGAVGAPTYSYVSATNYGDFKSGNYVATAIGGSDNHYRGAQLVANTGVILEGRGGFGLVAPPATKTGDYTMAWATDFHVAFDTAGGAITVNLPAAAASTRAIFIIRKVNASANALTIDPNGAELIDGAATLAVANTTAKMIQSNGTGWITIGTMT